MSYTTPPTFTAGTTLAAADLNILGTDIVYLKGITDGVAFQGAQTTISGAQSIPNATKTDVTWNSATWQYGTWWSSGVNLTVPAGAIPSGFTTIALMIVAAVRFVPNGSGTRSVWVDKNGVEVGGTSATAPSGENMLLTAIVFTTAAAADTIKIQAYQSSGGALNADQATLTVVRFAPAS